MNLSDLLAPSLTLAIIGFGIISANAVMYRRRVHLRNKRLASMRRHPSYVGEKEK